MNFATNGSTSRLFFVQDGGMKTPAASVDLNESNSRLAYSPREFAALFGKLYLGLPITLQRSVKAITRFDRIMIPKAEADRLLKSAHQYV